MDLNKVRMTVAPENKEKFEKSAYSWHLLIQCIGWDDLCYLYANGIPPFDSIPKDQRRADSKQAIIQMIMDDLRDSGLEVSEAKQPSKENT